MNTFYIAIQWKETIDWILHTLYIHTVDPVKLSLHEKILLYRLSIPSSNSLLRPMECIKAPSLGKQGAT